MYKSSVMILSVSRYKVVLTIEGAVSNNNAQNYTNVLELELLAPAVKEKNIDAAEG